MLTAMLLINYNVSEKNLSNHSPVYNERICGYNLHYCVIIALFFKVNFSRVSLNSHLSMRAILEPSSISVKPGSVLCYMFGIHQFSQQTRALS